VEQPVAKVDFQKIPTSQMKAVDLHVEKMRKELMKKSWQRITAL